MKEIWKDIKGYEGLYQVNSKGIVKGLPRTVTTKNGLLKRRKEKNLKPYITSSGYERVTLCKNGKTKHMKVHRLVANSFIPNDNNEETVNHKDFDKRNNNVENLEWVSRFQNIMHYHSENGQEYNVMEIINTYRITNSVKKVVTKHKINKKTVKNILESSGMAIQGNRKTIDMYSVDCEFIKRFNSVEEGAKWLRSNGYKKAVSKHISRHLNGNGKTAYKHKWKIVGLTNDILNNKI